MLPMSPRPRCLPGGCVLTVKKTVPPVARHSVLLGPFTEYHISVAMSIVIYSLVICRSVVVSFWIYSLASNRIPDSFKLKPKCHTFPTEEAWRGVVQSLVRWLQSVINAQCPAPSPTARWCCLMASIWLPQLQASHFYPNTFKQGETQTKEKGFTYI